MTKEITLTQGKISIVDDMDFEYLSDYRWYAGLHHGYWYAQTCSRGDSGKYITVRMHRKILGVGIGVLVDHIDGDGLNNVRSNLRPATRAENSRNSRKQSNSTNDYKGITFDARAKKWQALIRADGKSVSLGYFDTPEDGARAYDAAAKKCFGEFAHVNFPDESQVDSELSERLTHFQLARHNTSGYRGVTWDAELCKWRAGIHIAKRHYELGRFEQAIDAATAYDAALLEYGGNPKRLNFPELHELEDARQDEEFNRRGGWL